MKGSVLVVDDDRALANSLVDIFRIHSWEATAAYSGEAAVAAVEETSFDVIVMDIKMGGIHGVEASKAIRSRRPETRVILMTAYSANELVVEARSSGVTWVLAKPLSIPSLLELASEVLVDACPILVVDDDPDFLESLCQALDAKGLPTCTARDLSHALELLEGREEISVVLLDLKLGGFLQADAILSIREARPDTVVILVSGHPSRLEATISELPDGWLAGAFTKPLDLDRLVRMLEEFDAG